MLLSDSEREFLAAFISEATTAPFHGPATAELHRRNIYYDDLLNLLAAYYRENPPNQAGFGGESQLVLPPCPWADRVAAVGRDRELEGALRRTAQQVVP